MTERALPAVPDATADERRHVTVITPPAGWPRIDWHELWAYRELLWVLATRDVKVRYKQSLLGAGWAIVRPLLTMVVFTLLFGKLAKIDSDGLPYSVFVYAGLLPWTFFASVVGSASQSLLGSSHLVSKVYFPRLIIPLSSAGAPLADLAVSTAFLVALMAFYGIGWTPHLFAAPALALLVAVTALGVGTLLSALTVTYRDFTHITPFLVQLWMFATPVIYPLSLVPREWHWLMYLNPMTGLVEGFRACFLGRPFNWLALAASALVSLVALAVAVAYFEKAERRFADVI